MGSSTAALQWFFVLLATERHRHESHFQDEILRLANDLSIAIRETAQKNRELKKVNKTIELLARIDILTGLANRRMLEETLPREVARASRLEESLSLIFIDIDHFKLINDQFGHKVGDQVLAQMGSIFKAQLRSYALAARFGGDEFILLLPGTGREGAITIAQRIQAILGTSVIPEYPRLVAVSMGIASLSDRETGEELLARADAALYRAKGKGGDGFEIA